MREMNCGSYVLEEEGPGLWLHVGPDGWEFRYGEEFFGTASGERARRHFAEVWSSASPETERVRVAYKNVGSAEAAGEVFAEHDGEW